MLLATLTFPPSPPPQSKDKMNYASSLKEKCSSPEYYESSAAESRSQSESESTRSSGQRTPPSSLSKAVDR